MWRRSQFQQSLMQRQCNICSVHVGYADNAGTTQQVSLIRTLLPYALFCLFSATDQGISALIKSLDVLRQLVE